MSDPTLIRDPTIIEAAARKRERERVLVEELGQQIGYGRLMQLAERIWDWQQPGAAHSVGPCTSTLVPCPHPPRDRDANGHCPWCCGSGRVTRRVLQAIHRDSPSLKDKP